MDPSLAIGKLHTVYIAAEESKVAEIVAQSFDSFTLFREKGYYKGEQEEVSVLQIASWDTLAVERLALELKDHFHQAGVGLVVEGVYYRL